MLPSQIGAETLMGLARLPRSILWREQLQHQLSNKLFTLEEMDPQFDQN
jgi:hypothetical protein